MRSTRPMICPTRPNPAITTACSWLGILSYSLLGVALANSGLPIFSSNKNARGVIAIETVTTRFRIFCCSRVNRCWAVATLNSTKANSPPCASVTPRRILLSFLLPMSRAMIVSTTNLMSISNPAKPMMSKGLATINLTLMSIPTDIKNSPSSSPLKGSILACNSWRYSESASSTPVKNAPSAIDKPI